MTNIFKEFPDNTLVSMALSAGLSYVVSAVFNRGNPSTMAAIGAVAALTHACASVILRHLGLHPLSSNIVKTGLPYDLTSSLQTVGSVYLTHSILKMVGARTFDVAITSIIMVGMTLLANRNSRHGYDNVTFITLA